MVTLAEPPDWQRWVERRLAPPVYLLRVTVSPSSVTKEQADHQMSLAQKGWTFWSYLVDADEDIDVEWCHAEG